VAAVPRRDGVPFMGTFNPGHRSNSDTATPYSTTVVNNTSAADDQAHLIATLAACGLALRPEDEWRADELAMVAEALADLLALARWTPTTLVAALGGPITLIRDRDAPITTDEAGTRYPVLGLYDADARLLTVNDWSFDPRTGGAAGGGASCCTSWPTPGTGARGTGSRSASPSSPARARPPTRRAARSRTGPTP